MTSTINLKLPFDIQKDGNGTKRAQGYQIDIVETLDFEEFWKLLSDVLEPA